MANTPPNGGGPTRTRSAGPTTRALADRLTQFEQQFGVDLNRLSGEQEQDRTAQARINADQRAINNHLVNRIADVEDRHSARIDDLHDAIGAMVDGTAQALTNTANGVRSDINTRDTVDFDHHTVLFILAVVVAIVIGLVRGAQTDAHNGWVWGLFAGAILVLLTTFIRPTRIVEHGQTQPDQHPHMTRARNVNFRRNRGGGDHDDHDAPAAPTPPAASAGNRIPQRPAATPAPADEDDNDDDLHGHVGEPTTSMRPVNP